MSLYPFTILVMTVPIRSAWLAGSAQPGTNLDFDINLDFNLPVQKPILLSDLLETLTVDAGLAPGIS
jgi:hypothetical protein